MLRLTHGHATLEFCALLALGLAAQKKQGHGGMGLNTVGGVKPSSDGKPLIGGGEASRLVSL